MMPRLLRVRGDVVGVRALVVVFSVPRFLPLHRLHATSDCSRETGYCVQGDVR